MHSTLSVSGRGQGWLLFVVLLHCVILSQAANTFTGGRRSNAFTGRELPVDSPLLFTWKSSPVSLADLSVQGVIRAKRADHLPAGRDYKINKRSVKLEACQEYYTENKVVFFVVQNATGNANASVFNFGSSV